MYNKGSSKIDRVRRTPGRVQDPGRGCGGDGFTEITEEKGEQSFDIQRVAILRQLNKCLIDMDKVSRVLKCIIDDFEEGTDPDLSRALFIKSAGVEIGLALNSIAKLLKMNFKKGA